MLVTEASYSTHSVSTLEGAQGSLLTWAPVAIIDDFADDPELKDAATADSSSLATCEEIAYEEPSAVPSAEELCLGNLFTEQEDHDGANAIPAPVTCECVLKWNQPVRFCRCLQFFVSIIRLDPLGWLET